MFAHLPEPEQLEHFIAAYQEITGEILRLIEHRDRPDFHCHRQTGADVGVEVTIITRPPLESFFEDALTATRTMHPSDAAVRIYEQIERKEALRNSPGWFLPECTILLLSTPDCRLTDLAGYLLAEDFQDNGFTEIWLADHTEIEEYCEIELFGLKPLTYWGHHRRDRGKPFG